MRCLERRARARGSLWVLLVGILFVGAFVHAEPARAQFRNNGFQLPSIGWMSMGTTSDWINRNYGTDWGVTDQVTLGVGYFRAVGYNLWWDNQTAVGFGGAINDGATARTAVSLNVSTGLRYNFLDEKHRPFVAGHIHYVQLFNVDPKYVPGNAALGGAPLWVGGRVGAGYEWFFAEEMSVLAELDGVLFFNLDHPPKLSAIGRIAYNVYF